MKISIGLNPAKLLIGLLLIKQFIVYLIFFWLFKAEFSPWVKLAIVFGIDILEVGANRLVGWLVRLIISAFEGEDGID